MKKKKWTWHHWSHTVLPTSSSRYITRAISKQNHDHMQKVTREVQLWPSWPPPPHFCAEISGESSHDSKCTARRTSQTQQWPQETCWSLNIKEHKGHGVGNKSTAVWLKCLLSGGTLSLWGQPDRLRWWGYRPVTWPVPSQPGVGHRLSFLSAREASVREESDNEYMEMYCWHCGTHKMSEQWGPKKYKGCDKNERKRQYISYLHLLMPTPCVFILCSY